MRKPFLAIAVSLFVAACSDAPTGPANPLETAPTVRLSHMGGNPATDDLCGGFSPCDAFPGYAHGNPDNIPGFCFLPPTVDNHLSHPACSAPFVPGLDGIFKLAWCKVSYGSSGGATPPTIVSCQDPADWKPLTWDGTSEFYQSSVQFRRNEARTGETFRLYIVRGDQHFAHRDVVVDPNQTRPADDYLHAIGYGNEPVKVRITRSFTCVLYDTQAGGTDNAATCLIAGESEFPFTTGNLTTTFSFPDGNPTFLADFEVSECHSLGFSPDGLGGAVGNALVDVPLGGCKISVSSEELQTLTVPATIYANLLGASDDPFHPNARPNVLQYDELGIGVLPPTVNEPAPAWLGTANPPPTPAGFAYRALNWGVDKLRDLASFFGPQPLYAWPGSGWDFTRLSDFQVAWMPVMNHGNPGTDCASGLASCLNLGSFSVTDTVPVHVRATAPSIVAGDPALNVPGTRLHVFPETGSVSCPSPEILGQQCYQAGTSDNSTTPESSMWNHLVVITGPDGIGTVNWSLTSGENRLYVSACGVARPGANEPNPPAEPGDGVWGELIPADDPRICVNRENSLPGAVGYASAFDNGPADGLTPFEPALDPLGGFSYETAIYGLPLVFEAKTCPVITVDGAKGTNEWSCADVTGFIAPLKGPKATSDNAWLYTYNDGNALYLGIEVVNNELGNKIFINLLDSLSAAGSLVPAADDDILVLDFGDPTVKKDWYYTQACVGNNANSLCGSPDTENDLFGFEVEAAASLNAGRAFYEFKRPLRADVGQLANEDLDALPGDEMGLRIQITQGQGGGKGGFTYPDPQTSPTPYHRFRLK